MLDAKWRGDGRIILVEPRRLAARAAARRMAALMNSDVGGDRSKADFGACKAPKGEHVIGVLLADDRHQPVLVGGKPVTALVRVTTR